DYVAKNPWVLLPALVPALNAWLVLLGFQSGGIAAGSVAAAIQSYIGSVPRGSLFAFLQSHGAGGFAAHAVQMGGTVLTIAVVLAVLGKVLAEKNGKESDVAKALESLWKSIEAHHALVDNSLVGQAATFIEEGRAWAAGGIGGIAAALRGFG